MGSVTDDGKDGFPAAVCPEHQLDARLWLALPRDRHALEEVVYPVADCSYGFAVLNLQEVSRLQFDVGVRVVVRNPEIGEPLDAVSGKASRLVFPDVPLPVQVGGIVGFEPGAHLDALVERGARLDLGHADHAPAAAAW